jgi:hypothetical protein
MNNSILSQEIETWFKQYRETYKWPLTIGRQSSEDNISRLNTLVRTAISENNRDKIISAFITVHRWKTQNHRDQTSKYRTTLESRDSNYFNRLQELGPFTTNQNLGKVIKLLKIRNCNLPVCTAIASFLYGRNVVPILDKYLSQFFTRRFKFDSVDEKTKQILNYVNIIPFRLEDGGTGKLRLSVYYQYGFDYNLDQYLTRFVPECTRIAKDLGQAEIHYNDIQGIEREFLPIDVEMAIFSYSTTHSSLF